MFQKLKKRNGITLIALVVTIVVLIILAGITISTLTGENGIINKAQRASWETKYAQAKEEILLAVNAAKSDSGKMNEQKTFRQALEEQFKLEPLSETNVYSPNPITEDDMEVEGTNREIYKYKIDLETGKITTIDDNNDDNNETEEGIEYQVQINVKTSSFNETLGAFPVVYNIEGKSNGKTVYNDIVSVNVKNAGIETLNLNIKLPEGVSLTVKEIYSGANYNLESPESVEQVLITDEITEYEFSRGYNEKQITCSSDYIQ